MRRLRNLLVTGGCGFIGSAFIRYLFGRPDFDGSLANLDVLTYAANPDNAAGAALDARYRLVEGDICDGELVARLCRERDIDAIVHFAAESHVDRSIAGSRAFVHTNVVGTHELLEVVRAAPQIHFHHVSSDEVFGSLGRDGRFTELSPYRPSSPYSATKAASDHLVRAYAHTYGISTTISNCSNNYGPYQVPEKLIPLMVTNMLAGEELPIYGDGSNVRDWLFVDDHVEAIWLVMQQGSTGATYNIGGDCEHSNLSLVGELIDIVAELGSRDPDQLRQLITFVTDRPGHDRRYAIDAGKLKEQLGWSPRHDLSAGLRTTVRWYLDNADWVADARLRSRA